MIFRIIYLLIVLMFLIVSVSFSGEFKNVSTQKQTFTDVCYDEETGEQTYCTKSVQPDATVKTYLLLDRIDSAIWQKVSDEPYAPGALFDQDITVSANTTETITVDINSSSIKLATFSGGNVLVFINSLSNPFPVYLHGANNVSDFDELELINNRRIHTIYLQNPSDTTDVTVLFRVVP